MSLNPRFYRTGMRDRALAVPGRLSIDGASSLGFHCVIQIIQMAIRIRNVPNSMSPSQRAILSRISKIAAAEFRSNESDRRLITLLSTALIPFIIGVWGAFLPNLYESNTFISLSITALLGVVQIWLIWRSLDKPQSLGLLIANLAETEEALQNEREATAVALKEAGRLMVLQSYALQLYGLQSRAVIGDRLENLSCQDFFDRFLLTLIEDPETMFGFTSDDVWNFVVYLHDRTDDKLKPVWRRTDARHPSRDGETSPNQIAYGRSWDSGIGHVGMAFRRNEPILTEDASEPAVRKLFVAPGDTFRRYDDKFYRSFASIPFGFAQDSGRPLGVLVGTSSRIGAFDDRSSLPLRHAAEVLTGLSSFIKDLPPSPVGRVNDC